MVIAIVIFRAIYLGQVMWPEVQTAKAEQRHELVLHGKDVSDRIQNNGGAVDEEVFSLVKLNFLEISEAKLQTVPETLSSLVNLTSLVLKSNQLTKVPDGINRCVEIMHCQNPSRAEFYPFVSA